MGTTDGRIYLIIGIVVWTICAMICTVIASNKGRNAILWFVLGFLLGIVGVIIVACLKPVVVEQSNIEDGKHFDITKYGVENQSKVPGKGNIFVNVTIEDPILSIDEKKLKLKKYLDEGEITQSEYDEGLTRVEVMGRNF